MDELDRRLSALRAGIHDQITPPAIGGIVARARHRRAQRRAQYTVVGLVAALAIVVPVVALVGGRHSMEVASPPAGPATTAVPTTVTVTDTASAAAAQTTSESTTTSTAGSLVYDADFRNSGDVYALVGTPSPKGAVTLLYATRDDGRTWTHHATPLPPVTGDDGYSAELVVLGSGKVLVRQPLATADWGFQSWYSPDGGTSWAPVPGQAGGQTNRIESIPTGAVLTTECIVADPQHNDRCGGWNLVAIQPDSGKLAALTHQPDLDPLPYTRYEPAADGRWWVSGTVKGQPAVAVSSDGASWAVHTLPVTGKPIAIEVATAGSYVWAVVRGSTDSEKNALLGIARSRDFGASWSLMYTPTRGTAPRSFVGAPIPYPPGPGVIISTAPDEDMAYLVRDDGTTLASARPAPGWIRWTGGGYVSIEGNTVWIANHAYPTDSGAQFFSLNPLR